MIAVRALAGLGAGLVVGVSFAAIGQWRDPDWAFAVYLVVGSTFSAVALWFFPWFQENVSPGAVFMGVAIIAAATLSCLPWLPAKPLRAIVSGDVAGKIDVRLALAGLLGAFVYFMAPGAVWAYFERIGAASDVSPAAIGAALAVASIGGIFGALMVTMLPRAWGRGWPLAVNGAVALGSIFLLWGNVSELSLILAGGLFMATWQFAQPLFSGLCCDADARGRVVSGMGGIQTIGFGLGPAMSAVLLRNGDFSSVLWASAAAIIIGTMIVIVGGGSRAAPSAASTVSVESGR
jgi:predicted MFS family arabinose efflux permease